MRTSDLIDRIAQQCTLFACVDHVLNPTKKLAYPAAMVIPSEVSAAPDDLIGLPQQQDIRQVFSIFILMARRDDTDLTTGVDDLDDLLAQLRSVLPGWQIDPDHAPMNFAGGKLDKYHTGVICWREDYSVETTLRL